MIPESELNAAEEKLLSIFKSERFSEMRLAPLDENYKSAAIRSEFLSDLLFGNYGAERRRVELAWTLIDGRLNLDGLEISRLCFRNCSFDGGISLQNLRCIDLSLSDCQIKAEKGGDAISAQDAKIGNCILLTPLEVIGNINLCGASAEVLEGNKVIWECLKADTLLIKKFHCKRLRGWNTMNTILKIWRRSGFEGDPSYEQMEQSCHRHGLMRWARKFGYAAAEKKRKNRKGPRKFFGYISRLATGYGYKKHRLVLWPLLAVTGWFFRNAWFPYTVSFLRSAGWIIIWSALALVGMFVIVCVVIFLLTCLVMLKVPGPWHNWNWLTDSIKEIQSEN